MSELKEQLLSKINNKKAKVGVVGLGYVGLPLAVEKANAGYETIGFDVQDSKVNMVNKDYYLSLFNYIIYINISFIIRIHQNLTIKKFGKQLTNLQYLK